METDKYIIGTGPFENNHKWIDAGQFKSEIEVDEKRSLEALSYICTEKLNRAMDKIKDEQTESILPK